MHRDPSRLLNECKSAVKSNSEPEVALDIVPSCTELLTPACYRHRLITKSPARSAREAGSVNVQVIVPSCTATRAGLSTNTSPPTCQTANRKYRLTSCLHARSVFCRFAVIAAQSQKPYVQSSRAELEANCEQNLNMREQCAVSWRTSYRIHRLIRDVSVSMKYLK